ncbi:CPBP family intramembrane glutamic endopeptidase [Saccharospirillum mangrovi]|uniref:CPBP family intramembrane glutamic endopeptidase n=1 Tax=Saccharospirillum mangrovi TaxID=2161747 RepID=UPI000D332991|nr:CPBP family intramembrane glutamic endopeptidase [Saccharospirillum mangrovi]
MLAFGFFYSLSLIVLGLAQHDRLRYGGAVLVLFVAALIGYTDWLFFAVAFGYVLLTAWMRLKPGPLWLTVARGALWLVISAALFAHAVPGYQGLVVVADTALKANSLPSSLYVNYDKVLVAWSLLAFVPLFKTSLYARPLRWSFATVPALVIAIAVPLALAWQHGLIDWQPGLSAVFWIFAGTNLLNTCIAEELLFRGVLQGRLQRKLGPWPALVLAAALFGLAHIAGGWSYVAVVTLAGLGYGLAYLWTGHLIASVATHWALNLAHFALFTYPLTAPAIA